AQNEDGTSRCLLLQYVFPNGPPNELPADASEFTGEGQIPFALGQLSMLAAIPRAANGKTTWEVRSACLVKESVPIDPTVPRHRRQLKRTMPPAEETSIFTLGKKSGDVRVIHKQYILKTRQEVDGKPYLQFQGEGLITFDVKAGLVRAMELKGTLQRAGS